MARYDFYCPVCNTVYEKSFSMTDEKVGGNCPTCGVELVRQFGVGTITGSGGGWCGNSKSWKTSIAGVHEQSLARKREGDGVRKELGLGHLNVDRNIH